MRPVRHQRWDPVARYRGHQERRRHRHRRRLGHRCHRHRSLEAGSALAVARGSPWEPALPLELAPRLVRAPRLHQVQRPPLPAPQPGPLNLTRLRTPPQSNQRRPPKRSDEYDSMNCPPGPPCHRRISSQARHKRRYQDPKRGQVALRQFGYRLEDEARIGQWIGGNGAQPQLAIDGCCRHEHVAR